MGMSFTSNAGQMVAQIELRLKALPTDVTQAVTMSAHEGADKMQQVIIDSETETGRKRAAHGHGAPGRIDTGDMFNDVKTEVKLESMTTTGKLGWLYNPLDYFGTQDNTQYSISGTMHSLLQGFTTAKEALIGRMAQIAKNGKLG